MKHPLISVIVPVYNTQAYLCRCVDSLIHQTYTNIEILLIDDGATDGSGAICDEYALADQRVRVIHQQNRGVSAARNAGLLTARGDVIGFVDSDDYCELCMYERLILMMTENQADIVVCSYSARNQRNSGHVECEAYDSEQAIKLLLSRQGISYSLCDKVFSARSIAGILLDEQISHNEDFLFVYLALARAEHVAVTSAAYYHYCDNPQSATRVQFSHKRMTAIDVQERVLADVCIQYPALSRLAEEEFLKSNLYTAQQMAVAGYTQEQDRRRVRDNISSRLGRLCRSPLAVGYKVQGVLLSISQPLFDRYVCRRAKGK